MLTSTSIHDVVDIRYRTDLLNSGRTRTVTISCVDGDGHHHDTTIFVTPNDPRQTESMRAFMDTILADV